METGVRVPGSVAEAEQMALAGLTYLVVESPGEWDAAGQVDRLKVLEQVCRRVSAAQAAALSALAASAGHESDGCQSPTRWQTVVLGVTKAEARRRWRVAKMLAGLPAGWAALADGRVAESILTKIGAFVQGLPEYARAGAAQILVGAAVADGVTEKDIVQLMRAIKDQLPDDGDDDDDDDGGRNEVELSTTLDGVGVLRGRVDAELADLAQAVFSALGARKGDGDDRTVGERNHDALKEALRRVTDGGMLGEVRGRKPHIEVLLPLGTLRGEPGARQAETTWSRQAATSLALALSCDAKISGTVTGHVQPWDRLVTLTRRMLDDLGRLFGGARTGEGECRSGRPGLLLVRAIRTGKVGVRPGWPTGPDEAARAGLPVFDWDAVSDERLAEIIDRMLGWAAEALSGPDGLAAGLRTTLAETLCLGGNRLDEDGTNGDGDGPAGVAEALLTACRGTALPLDIGEPAETVPLRIRQLVERRDKQCQVFPAPRVCCDVPAHRSHIHHIGHRSHGGDHHHTNLLTLCSRHHERFVHGLGWTIRLNGDGSTTVTSPDGEVTMDDRPPTARSP